MKTAQFDRNTTWKCFSLLSLTYFIHVCFTALKFLTVMVRSKRGNLVFETIDKMMKETSKLWLEN